MEFSTKYLMASNLFRPQAFPEETCSVFDSYIFVKIAFYMTSFMGSYAYWSETN